MPDTLPASPFDSTIDKLTLGNILSAIDERRKARQVEGHEDVGSPAAGGDRGRLVLLAERTWIERVRKQAKRRGMTLSSYLGQAVSRQLALDEGEERASSRASP